MEDLATTIFVILDDLYHATATAEIAYRSNKETAIMSDSEVLAIGVLGDMLGIDSENALVSFVKKNLKMLFPRICERSRFNRLRRNLSSVTEQIWLKLNGLMPWTMDELRIIDSFPLPVCAFGRAAFRNSRFCGEEANYGHCASKKETFFGYKVHAMCSANGYITDFLITPASTDDRTAVWELIENYRRRIALVGDKGYISPILAQDLMTEKGIQLFALKKKNDKNQDPKWLRRAVFKIRRRIETSFSQLARQFRVESTLAKAMWGLRTRLVSKLLAFNLGFFINSICGREDHLAHIKSHVF
jgi:IS5 family transposase